ncbi:hypothetical protein E2C01_071374 [Portunus trituberculatus]|uniref:Uncharacterized protein n=1 Tax=Portunus trituberculatus TaxID=210409 RepID=A0A5B7I622_PORTR|nr:hypothetical protein [Portunus trituberculatus]
MAQHLTDLRQQERKKYWVSFLDQVCRTQSLWEVWHHVNSVWSKSRRVLMPCRQGMRTRFAMEGSLILFWPSCGTPGGV